MSHKPEQSAVISAVAVTGISIMVTIVLWAFWLGPALYHAGPLVQSASPLLDAVLKIAVGVIGMQLTVSVLYLVLGTIAFIAYCALT